MLFATHCGAAAPQDAAEEYRALMAQAAQPWVARFYTAPRATQTNAVAVGALIPAAHQDDLYRWWLDVALVCRRLGRLQDAHAYLYQAACVLPTSHAFYVEWLADMAALRRQQGCLDDAAALYAQLFRVQPRQPTPVWHEYIRLLFDAGRFEEGVTTILAGARQNGISPKYLERDYFIKDACWYWHHFGELDILDWHDLLGEQLAREELSSGKESLLSLLITSRALLKKVYPEYFALPEDDLAALRARLAVARTSVVARAQAGAPRDAVAPASVALVPPAMAVWPGTFASDITNALIEDGVNRALLATQVMWQHGEGDPVPWRALLDAYTTQQLQRVIVDGVSARYHCNATLGGIYAYKGAGSNALQWLQRALAVPDCGGNSRRLCDVLLWLNDVYLMRGTFDLENAEYYVKWATTLVESNRYLRVRVGTARARLALFRGDADGNIELLQGVVDTGGTTVRRVVYERLARAYYRAGRFREGFNAYVEGLRRTRCKMEVGMWDHMFDGLFMNRSLLTADELRQMRAYLRASALRYPAILEYAPPQARLLALADEAWIAQQSRLASIQESAQYHEDNWLFVSNCVRETPSVRAGMLYTTAQLARDASGTNALDWRGWLSAWRVAGGETHSGKPGAPTDSGGMMAINTLLLEQLAACAPRLDPAAAAQIANAVAPRMRGLDDAQFTRLAAILTARGAPSSLADLYLQRVSAMRVPYREHATVRALTGMTAVFSRAQSNVFARIAADCAKRVTNMVDAAQWRALATTFQYP